MWLQAQAVSRPFAATRSGNPLLYAVKTASYNSFMETFFPNAFATFIKVESLISSE